jgi:ATP-dependent DNA helicase DinG
MKQMEKLFGDGGLLSRRLPGFGSRPQQVAVAGEIAAAMARPGGVALIEAGTGVGKTLAYLLPAHRRAAPDRKVIVSTHSLALQAQLIDKDIPFVQSLSTKPLNAVVLKGRGNYLCLQDYNVAKMELWSVGDSQFQEIGAWSKKTKTGDVAELPFSYSGWVDIRANTDTCKGRECRHYEECFYFNAREAAEDASIIIVNHALFFSDLALRQMGEEATLLPEYSFVVFDEAHHLEAAAAGAFGIACTSSRVPSIVDKIRRLARSIDISRERLKLIEAANEAIFAPLAAIEKTEFTLDDSLPGYDMRSARFHVAEVGSLLDSMATEMLKVDPDGNPFVKDRIDGLRRLCARTKEELSLIFNGDDENFLRWGSVNRNGRRGVGATVNWTPINVAPILEKALWLSKSAPGAALISATLATDGGFTFLRQRLGIAPRSVLGNDAPENERYPDLSEGDSAPSRFGRGGEKRAGVGSHSGAESGIKELVAGSPFDYPNQALLYVPQGMPPPGDDPFYLHAVVEDILRLIDAAGGGAFLLFTSHRALNLTYEKLAMSELPYPLFRQGDMPNARLVDAFRAEANGILLGSQSFWEGVDIPGHSLRLVVIDKLPFTTPDNPMHKARVEKITQAGGDWFNDYALPQAQIKLKQGFGRLIRTSTDRGVVALMDSRLRTKYYGRRILATLPPARLTGDIEDVMAFFRRRAPARDHGPQASQGGGLGSS